MKRNPNYAFDHGTRDTKTTATKIAANKYPHLKVQLGRELAAIDLDTAARDRDLSHRRRQRQEAEIVADDIEQGLLDFVQTPTTDADIEARLSAEEISREMAAEEGFDDYLVTPEEDAEHAEALEMNRRHDARGRQVHKLSTIVLQDTGTHRVRVRTRQ